MHEPLMGIVFLRSHACWPDEYVAFANCRFTGADNAEEVAQMAAEAFERDCPVSCGVQVCVVGGWLH
jgi:hypothetical protein